MPESACYKPATKPGHGAEQKWEGFEVMTGMAGKAVMMSLA